MLREDDTQGRREGEPTSSPRARAEETHLEPSRDDVVWLSNGRGPEPYDVDWME